MQKLEWKKNIKMLIVSCKIKKLGYNDIAIK